MSRTYEQIRSKALELLRKKQAGGQYIGFYNAIEAAFADEQPAPQQRQGYGHAVYRLGPNIVLTDAEQTLVLEVFWDFFREGIITIGLDHLNREFPFFRVSERGRGRLEEAK